jgi:CDP-4-dehydro-6-deoxyglucose reductase
MTKPLDQNATIKSIDHLADDIIALHIQLDDEFAYKAGQYVTLRADESHPPRAYSITNAPALDSNKPDNNIIECHLKITEGGTVSTHIAANLKTGDKLEVHGPHGENTFDTDDKRPLLLIAGGLGITPMKAILETALNSNHSNHIYLYWGTNTTAEQYIAPHFVALDRKYYNFHFHSAVQTPVTTPVFKVFEKTEHMRIHLAGPPSLIKAALPTLIEKGADRKDIYFDPFE